MPGSCGVTIARALQFLAMIEAITPLTVASVGDEEQAGATRMLRRYSDRDPTFPDAVGLHLAQARRLKSCWSTDFHLGISGVPLVITEH